jgi:TonB family protein
VLSVQLRQDGSVVGWELVKSTGSRRLDQEIERVARKVKGLDPLPAGFAGKLAIVHVPITFALREE